ncbi:hypothetical protein BSFA1_62850 (plasmid) [Burkholderia sp. SFA1]|nr:hypothetical protein BSFA1_62850 [Burkholderia sp. SFA1]
MHAQLRISREKTRQLRHQLIHAERMRRADAQIAGRFARSYLRLGFFEGFENLVARAEESFAFAGKAHGACRAMQQLHAEPAFEIVHALAHEGLADVQDICGRGEATGFHYGFENPHFQQSFIFH